MASEARAVLSTFLGGVPGGFGVGPAMPTGTLTRSSEDGASGQEGKGGKLSARGGAWGAVA